MDPVARDDEPPPCARCGSRLDDGRRAVFEHGRFLHVRCLLQTMAGPLTRSPVTRLRADRIRFQEDCPYCLRSLRGAPARLCLHQGRFAHAACCRAKGAHAPMARPLPPAA